VDARGARALLDRFGEFADQFADCFSRRVQRNAASQYLEGLFNDSERKSMQAMHGRLSDPIHYQALQHFITHSPWPAEPLWARLADVVPERRGILALDDTGLPKRGRHSVGVKRQYSGTLGKTGNCQVAVSSLLIAKDLVWPLSCELYLPHDWLDDDVRRTEAGIPSGVRFREKWRMALAQVRGPQARLPADSRRHRCRLRLDRGVSTWTRAPRSLLRGRHPFQSQTVAVWCAARVHRGGAGGADADAALAARLLGTRHQRAVGCALCRPSRAPHAESGRALAAVRTVADHGRTEVLLAEPGRVGLAHGAGGPRPVPLAGKFSIVGTCTPTSYGS